MGSTETYRRPAVDARDNGHTYYTLEGQHLLDPRDAAARPAQESLAWHSEAVFLAG
jgi:hypothetical protein